MLFIWEMTQRRFRRKMKRESWNEAYYSIRPKSYQIYESHMVME